MSNAQEEIEAQAVRFGFVAGFIACGLLWWIFG